MQEAFLRRHRDNGTPIGKQYRLTQLQVPVAYRQLEPLISREREVRSFHVVENRLEIRLTDPRHGLANHTHRCPSLHIERCHMPRKLALEPVLQLDRTPLIERSVPTGRLQPRGACYGPWIMRAVR